MDPPGGATIDNMPDINKDGVPDVIIQDKNNNPVYVNGYATVQSDWPNALLYHVTYPDRAFHAEYKQQQGKSITKHDFINNVLSVTHFGYDDDTFLELLRQIGTVTGYNIHRTPQWYQNELIDPKSGYQMKKLVNNAHTRCSTSTSLVQHSMMPSPLPKTHVMHQYQDKIRWSSIWSWGAGTGGFM